MRAVDYTRQSKRRTDKSEASPEAQHAKCMAMITAKGWSHAGHFSDVGRSGWDPNVERPDFEEMMTAVRAGHVDAVIVFALSRLTRQGVFEALAIVQELDKYGVILVSVEEPFLDTSSPVGLAIFALIAALAKQESDLKSEYITAAKETIRNVGGHTSGMAPYGFTKERVQRGKLNVVRLIPHPQEAAHVRQMVAWATEGKSAALIARELNQAKVPTKNANDEARMKSRRKRAQSEPTETPTWTSTTVLRVLRDPRLAGYAIEWTGKTAKTKEAPGTAGKRSIIRDGEGRPMAAHEAVVKPDDWWRLQDTLDGRTPVVRQTRRSRPSLLAGAGILFCDVCGSVMVTDERNGKTMYRCNRASAGLVPGHGGLNISMAAADDVVARDVWSRLEAMDPSDPEDLEFLSEAARRFAAQQDTSERQAELAAAKAELTHVQAALATLYEDRQEGLYPGETGKKTFVESVTRLTAHEERMTERVSELESSGPGTIAIPLEWTEPEMDPVGPGSTWDGWTLQERRDFIALFVDRIRITKSIGRGRNANTEDRVLITWAEAPDDEGKHAEHGDAVPSREEAVADQ
ncbi:recombinase family protein [Streptomyces sp. NBC_01016]|uniref:recombinase family protein n=1 Tax=Streptomyces sp. NBC_01016 TaxID=2903720 RepID=UPI00224E94A9|nr:recombinase family protein [Streptomyces sp. NBC_01016]MCX4832842.1 recombinase family protein [Streptomyces sp. NBC_01016]